MDTFTPFNNINSQYRTANRNPIFQGGMTQVQTPFGMISVPVSWMQQLSFNRQNGDTNGFSRFFGSGISGNQYSSNAQQQQFVRQIQPRYGSAQGALDPYTTANQRMQSLERPMRLPQNQYATENVNNMGQGVRGVSQAQKAQQEQQNIVRSGLWGGVGGGTARRAVWQSQDAQRRMQEDMARFQRMQPTTSNLPIQERVVKTANYA